MHISKLTKGLTVRAGYRRGTREFIDANTFTGFKVDNVHYHNLKTLKAGFDVKNLRDLEVEADRCELGSVTAEFYNEDGGYHWAAYLWNGAFRVGTSADRLFIDNIDQ
jgi:hypothetical protein